MPPGYVYPVRIKPVLLYSEQVDEVLVSVHLQHEYRDILTG
jgi:hypothetical protein